VTALDRTQKSTLSTGTLLTLDNQINVATGTVRARASFANAHNELFPNQFVNVRLLVKTLADVDLVPDAAIQRNNDVAFLYVVQPDSTVQSRNIKILASDAGVSAITGAEPNEQVVTDGFDKLQNGNMISIKTPPGAAAPGRPAPATAASASDVKKTG
jgi:multidrug efflux system membrane fusion protein